MVGHTDAEGPGHSCYPPPLRHAAGNGDVHVEDIHSTVGHEVSAPMPRYLSLSRVDGNAFPSDSGVPLYLVLPLNGLFQPGQTKILRASRKSHGVIHRPGLVGVDAEEEVIAADFAREASAFQVFLYR